MTGANVSAGGSLGMAAGMINITANEIATSEGRAGATARPRRRRPSRIRAAPERGR